MWVYSDTQKGVGAVEEGHFVTEKWQLVNVEEWQNLKINISTSNAVDHYWSDKDRDWMLDPLHESY